MVIRTIHGKQVECQHIYALRDIVFDSEWISPSGSIVKIEYIDDANQLIYYHDITDSTKQFFNDSIKFQLNYSKIICQTSEQ